jgi:2-hydroxy-3-keto-5-methylthiopentenyl-1-phosphate phosphatase
MVKLLSSDLNGTLVHQHTMSDMIRLYVGIDKFARAEAVFKKQTSGEASIEEAFANAGPLTRGLTLGEAIEYTVDHMRYVNGFQEFVDILAERGIPFVINSTGYSVTIYAIRDQVGAEKIHGMIGNSLQFAMAGDLNSILREDELEGMVKDYFSDATNPIYDLIRATGVVELGIKDEEAKAKLLLEYLEGHFPDVATADVLHMGDTMGDSGGIVGIAQAGGVGVAFNYNEALEKYLKKQEGATAERIYMVDPKGGNSNLKNVLKIVGN